MNDYKPLAERIRPESISDIFGQEHLLKKGSVLYEAVEKGHIPSMIFWGPPGVGKTTLAHVIAEKLGMKFYALSAIQAGVKEVRQVIEIARKGGKLILFIDEIHRFNKGQQDALLGAIERGLIIFIGATTENPSFEVNAALLSRCQVYILKSLDEKNLQTLARKAVEKDEYLSKKEVEFKEWEALLRFSGGDARKLLNILDLIYTQSPGPKMIINNKKVTDVIQSRMAFYDKKGEQHYDIVSAFIKSIRGSDPNGALYWMSRMLKGGEDPKFLARRMLILASEDIGNANPTALVLANNCFQAIDVIGMPEGRIILSQTCIYLATSPKSNASYLAIKNAYDLVEQYGDQAVPLGLRNAPTALMKKSGYGKDYLYGHDYPGNFVEQEYMPEALTGKKMYEPGNNPRENEIRLNLRKWWKDKYGY